MTAERPIDWSRVPGYRWHENGQSAFSGALLSLYRRLDCLFLRWAAERGAAEHRFPTFIPARELDRLDYFRSFPHLVTFPVALDPAKDNLAAFARGAPLDGHGNVQLTERAPVSDVLTPAACYHFYVQFQGDALMEARYVTTRATCFRREEYYAPLQRQWSFSMREIVCLGTADEVKAFLAGGRATIEGFCKKSGLPVEWQEATDPFFEPSRSAKYLSQKLDPVKTEMVFRDSLAIGSVNFHRNYFGDVFQITRAGAEVYSGCIAFGLERWMFAFLSHFGIDERDWPDLMNV